MKFAPKWEDSYLLRRRKDKQTIFMMICFLIPPLAVFGTFYVWPFLKAFYYSLFSWSGYSQNMTFVGLDNFKRAFNDSVFWQAFSHNMFFLVWCTIITLILSLFFAICFTRLRVRFRNFFRIVYFFPNTLSVVIVGTLWAFIYNPSFGLLNGFLESIGLENLILNWLGDKKVVLAALVAPQTWMYIGFYLVLFIAAIQNIPEEYYESATLDGAGQWRQFFSLTMPLIWGTLRVALVHLIANALEKTFSIVYVMTGGGPSHASELITTYMYDQAFTYGKFGYGSAIGVLLFILVAVISLSAYKLTEREAVEY